MYLVFLAEYLAKRAQGLAHQNQCQKQFEDCVIVTCEDSG